MSDTKEKIFVQNDYLRNRECSEKKNESKKKNGNDVVPPAPSLTYSSAVKISKEKVTTSTDNSLVIKGLDPKQKSEDMFKAIKSKSC